MSLCLQWFSLQAIVAYIVELLGSECGGYDVVVDIGLGVPVDFLLNDIATIVSHVGDRNWFNVRISFLHHIS